VAVSGQQPLPNRLDLPSGANGRLYWPKAYDVEEGKRALVIALHGLKQTPEDAMSAWRPVAESLNIIVLTPSGNAFEHGYTREPIDDRVRIRELRDHMVKTYGVDPSQVYVAGFSRGGNYAIELGLKYPDIFPRVMCLYGFYNTANATLLETGMSEKLYEKSHFYLVTGHGDMTENSLRGFHLKLKDLGVSSKLHVFPNLFHAYPENFPAFFKDVLRLWKDIQP
jgi:predicted esterase